MSCADGAVSIINRGGWSAAVRAARAKIIGLLAHDLTKTPDHNRALASQNGE
jgi:hypothetical protein